LLLSGRDSGIDAKAIESFVKSLKLAGIDEQTRSVVNGTAQYLYDAFSQFVTTKDGKKDHSVLNKMLKKIHTPMLFLTAIDSITRQVEPIYFGAWARKFLIEDYKSGGAYGQRCSAGSAKKENVQGRLKIMKNDFYSKIDDVIEKVKAKEESEAAKKQASAAKEAAEAAKLAQKQKEEDEAKKAQEEADANLALEQAKIADGQNEGGNNQEQEGQTPENIQEPAEVE
jgi:uncharacterized protein YdaU (DUF1376 family)